MLFFYIKKTPPFLKFFFFYKQVFFTHVLFFLNVKNNNIFFNKQIFYFFPKTLIFFSKKQILSIYNLINLWQLPSIKFFNRLFLFGFTFFISNKFFFFIKNWDPVYIKLFYLVTSVLIENKSLFFVFFLFKKRSLRSKLKRCLKRTIRRKIFVI